MSKYIVVAVRTDINPDSDQEEIEVRAPEFFETGTEVENCLRRLQEENVEWDWRIYEVVEGKARQKSIVFSTPARIV